MEYQIKEATLHQHFLYKQTIYGKMNQMTLSTFNKFMSHTQQSTLLTNAHEISNCFVMIVYMLLYNVFSINEGSSKFLNLGNVA